MKNYAVYYFKVNSASGMEAEGALSELGEFMFDQRESKILFGDGTKDEDEFFVFLPEYRVLELQKIIEKTKWTGFSKNVTDAILINQFRNKAFEEVFQDDQNKTVLKKYRQLNLTKDMVLEMILASGIESLTELELSILKTPEKMKLVNHANEIFVLNISGYMLANSEGVQNSSDWLRANLQITQQDQYYERELEFLTLEELERLICWLESIEQKKTTEKRLDFVDPNLFFLITQRSGSTFVKLVDLQEDQSHVSWDMLATDVNLTNSIRQLKKTIVDFPCRCGHEHNLE
jgi:hypothetical protein